MASQAGPFARCAQTQSTCGGVRLVHGFPGAGLASAAQLAHLLAHGLQGSQHLSDIHHARVRQQAPYLMPQSHLANGPHLRADAAGRAGADRQRREAARVQAAVTHGGRPARRLGGRRAARSRAGQGGGGVRQHAGARGAAAWWARALCGPSWRAVAWRATPAMVARRWCTAGAQVAASHLERAWLMCLGWLFGRVPGVHCCMRRESHDTCDRGHDCCGVGVKIGGPVGA